MNKQWVKGLCIWEIGHINLQMGKCCLRLLCKVQDTVDGVPFSVVTWMDEMEWRSLAVRISRKWETQVIGRATWWPPSGWWLKLFGEQSYDLCISVNEEQTQRNDRDPRRVAGILFYFFLFNERAHMIPVWQGWVRDIYLYLLVLRLMCQKEHHLLKNLKSKALWLGELRPRAGGWAVVPEQRLKASESAGPLCTGVPEAIKVS